MTLPALREDAPGIVEARPARALGTGEFVALASAMMAMLALSIDVMLPALSVIGNDLGVASPNQPQYVVSFLIFGMAIGQLPYGPLSESLGRKTSILIGLTIFGVGCLACAQATDLRLMLTGRFLQGLGAAGPRIVTMALIRDQHSGPDMARIMSLVIAVLMVGPLVAPFLGQGILLLASWRLLFLFLLAFDLTILIWLAARQPETLPRTRRLPLRWLALASAVREVAASRIAIGYAVAAGFVFAALFAYVNSAQQIYQDQYGVGAWFPFCFSASGVAIAAASLVNARLVARIPMRTLCYRAALGMSLFAALFLGIAYGYAGTPPLIATMVLVSSIFFCAGSLFGNLNALAMEPLGHIAGVAAGVVGSLTWFLAAVLATAIGQALDGTVVPLAGGLLALSVALLIVMRWTETDLGNLVRPS